MKVIDTPLPGVLLIEPAVHRDARGFFLESFHEGRYREAGVEGPFLQENHSRSVARVLRGLHYQLRQPQGKLVEVTRGEVFDVAVDLRRGSATFGRWYGTTLDDRSRRQLYIPPGFGHGFCVLSEIVDLQYRCTDYYDPEDQRGILWSDREIGIEWPISDPILSDRDANQPLLGELPPEALPELEVAR